MASASQSQNKSRSLEGGFRALGFPSASQSGFLVQLNGCIAFRRLQTYREEMRKRMVLLTVRTRLRPTRHSSYAGFDYDFL
jgi:hypothetical protein